MHSFDHHDATECCCPTTSIDFLGADAVQLQDSYTVANGGSFNYLGGALDSATGKISVAGMLELDGPQKSTLGVLHAAIDSDGGGWRWDTMTHAGPVYTSVDFQPLYPQLTYAMDGSLHILATVNSDAPCPSSTRPGHINMGAMYRQLRYYVGYCNDTANHNWTYLEAWRDLTPDAAEHPQINGDPCLLHSERFPHVSKPNNLQVLFGRLQFSLDKVPCDYTN